MFTIFSLQCGQFQWTIISSPSAEYSQVLAGSVSNIQGTFFTVLAGSVSNIQGTFFTVLAGSVSNIQGTFFTSFSASFLCTMLKNVSVQCLHCLLLLHNVHEVHYIFLLRNVYDLHCAVATIFRAQCPRNLLYLFTMIYLRSSLHRVHNVQSAMFTEFTVCFYYEMFTLFIAQCSQYSERNSDEVHCTSFFRTKCLRSSLRSVHNIQSVIVTKFTIHLSLVRNVYDLHCAVHTVFRAQCS